MQVERIRALKDNYIFLLSDAATGTAAVVDPAEVAPVLRALERRGLRLVAIFNTHHHGDHVGGNHELLQAFPELQIYGSAQDRGRIPGQNVELADGDTVHFAGEPGRVLFVPGHTLGHIAYYFERSGDLFCGDTLFAGGCGRLFEGTAAQMQHSLARLASLPESTRVWCAHEYTLGNLRFAHSVEPGNAALAERLAAVEHLRRREEATIPSTIGLELSTNPFLRWQSPELQRCTGQHSPVALFAKLRSLKDRYLYL
ncbi:hydroxyacylglutathione hydrolase [Gloeobacter kilaueensis]|uniref:Hydroxyacylglutathione hydrolase n=1 Tax=Gloeobacter kilaueensis (strain ATCC BAA-2537 / CCAP 1431/1 / ULC 316 / JS1) TaxID=1183438 RepID=U5QK31_GLOK1|nr:hydroxyacylglutathione hydrolase [Gloeobacter kilaueensis]AGY59286.1 hydroxyacylglutathione hydrolase [Gloeobacter kilaueensis JS1]